MTPIPLFRVVFNSKSCVFRSENPSTFKKIIESRASRRHLYTRLVQISSRRAASATTAPGTLVAASIRARSSKLQRRRRSRPEIKVT